jgi:hypothetical protein
MVRRPEISGRESLTRGTRITVQHIVEQVQAGQTVDTILAALTYYYDHEAELDCLPEESQLERVIVTQGLQVEPVTEGVAGRWSMMPLDDGKGTRGLDCSAVRR